MGLLDKLLPEYREKMSRLNNLILELRHRRDEVKKAKQREGETQIEVDNLTFEVNAIHQQMVKLDET